MNPNPESDIALAPPIILLDLNYTLIENCDERAEVPFPDRIDTHRYRRWLIDLLIDSRVHVFILTARPEKHTARTLHHLYESTGWAPERYYGNTHGEPPPQAKQRMLLEKLFPELGAPSLTSPSRFLGIESNPRTRAMYARHLIPSLSCQQLLPGSNLAQVWKSLATGLFATSPSQQLSTGTCANSSPGMTSLPESSPTSPATT